MKTDRTQKNCQEAEIHNLQLDHKHHFLTYALFMVRIRVTESLTNTY